MALKQFLFVSCLSICIFIAAAITKDDVEKSIQEIEKQITNLTTISDEITTANNELISNYFQEIQTTFKTKVDDILNITTSIKEELTKANYSFQDTQLEEMKIQILPEAYASKFVEHANAAIAEKSLEIKLVVETFLTITANCKTELDACGESDQDCIDKVSEAVNYEIINIEKEVETAANYSSEIIKFLEEDKKNELSIGEKELKDFSLFVRVTLFQEPINVIIEPVYKDVKNIQSKINNLSNRYTIDLLFDYTKPVKEATDDIIMQLNQYKSFLERKKNTIINEDKSKSSEVDKCLNGTAIFDEIIGSNFTDLNKLAKTVKNELSSNSGQLKKVVRKIQRTLDTLDASDFNSLKDIENSKTETENDINQFNIDFDTYNTIEIEFEQFKKNFTVIVNSTMEEPKKIFSAASDCLNDINAGVSVGSFTLLAVLLIALCNITFL